MYIAETFTSLQGEGLLVGTPSFFIRTSGCNLRCRWCDTDYTSWQPEGERVSVPRLVAMAEEAGVGHVVLTGGEPLLQREVGTLSRSLFDAGFHLTVETAGTVDPDFECSLLSVSPKTANSDPGGRWEHRHRDLRLRREAAARLLRRFPDHQIKLVVQGAGDMPEILELLAEVGPVAPHRVLLMPEGRTAEQAAGRAREVARLCLDHGFRYTPRLHLDLWGGGRGV